MPQEEYEYHSQTQNMARLLETSGLFEHVFGENYHVLVIPAGNEEGPAFYVQMQERERGRVQPEQMEADSRAALELLHHFLDRIGIGRDAPAVAESVNQVFLDHGDPEVSSFIAIIGLQGRHVEPEIWGNITRAADLAEHARAFLNDNNYRTSAAILPTREGATEMILEPDTRKIGRDLAYLFHEPGGVEAAIGEIINEPPESIASHARGCVRLSLYPDEMDTITTSYREEVEGNGVARRHFERFANPYEGFFRREGLNFTVEDIESGERRRKLTHEDDMFRRYLPFAEIAQPEYDADLTDTEIAARVRRQKEVLGLSPDHALPEFLHFSTSWIHEESGEREFYLHYTDTPAHQVWEAIRFVRFGLGLTGDFPEPTAEYVVRRDTNRACATAVRERCDGITMQDDVLDAAESMVDERQDPEAEARAAAEAAREQERIEQQLLTFSIRMPAILVETMHEFFSDLLAAPEMLEAHVQRMHALYSMAGSFDFTQMSLDSVVTRF